MNIFRSVARHLVLLTRSSASAVALVALLIAVQGCGSKSTGPETYAVTGVVTQAGKPVAGAVINFVPTAETGAAPGQATTGEDGSFEANIYLDNGKTTKPGLPAGSYKVTVVKMEMPGEASITKPPKNTLPAKFATPESTTLEAKVDPAGTNQFDYAL